MIDGKFEVRRVIKISSTEMWLVGAILISFLPVGLLFYLLMQRLKDKDGKIRRSLFVKYSVGIFVPALIIFLIVVRMPFERCCFNSFSNRNSNSNRSVFIYNYSSWI
jgi:nitrogen fixation/metabolism regulation signal transduction histidine kinase